MDPSSGLAMRLGAIDLKNPVVCGSGEHVMTELAINAAIDSGVAAVVAKSAGETTGTTRRQLEAAAYQPLSPDWSPRPTAASASPGDSLLNRSGPVPMDFDAWSELLARADRRASSSDAYVIGSVLPANADQAPELARRMSDAGVRWIELNLSAPHATEAGEHLLRVTDQRAVLEVVSSVRRVLSGPLSVKVTSEAADVVDLARAACAGGADSVVLCGRRMGFLPDPESERAVLDSFGAIGGSWELPLTLRWVAKSRATLGREVPVVGTGGARSAMDVVRFVLAGASAVQLTSVALAGGVSTLTRIIDELSAYVLRRGISISDLVGRAADSAKTYAEISANRAEGCR